MAHPHCTNLLYRATFQHGTSASFLQVNKPQRNHRNIIRLIHLQFKRCTKYFVLMSCNLLTTGGVNCRIPCLLPKNSRYPYKMFHLSISDYIPDHSVFLLAMLHVNFYCTWIHKNKNPANVLLYIFHVIFALCFHARFASPFCGWFSKT